MIENVNFNHFSKLQTDYINVVRNAYISANCVVNTYPHKKEILIYNQDFLVKRPGIEVASNKEVDRTRKFKYNFNGVLVANKNNVVLSDLLKCQSKSKKRSLDSVYSFALSNDWNYFCTFTFDPKQVDRASNFLVKQAWSLFNKQFKYFYPQGRILSVIEYHEKGCIHFHSLIGGVDLSEHLDELFYVDCEINRKKELVGKEVLNSFGDKVFKLDFYRFGFSHVVFLGDKSCPERVVNYLSKYISKDMIIEYQKKRYYHSRFLLARKKKVTFVTDFDISSLSSSINCPGDIGSNFDFLSSSEYNVVLRKNTSRFLIYDVFCNKSDE